MQDDLRAETDEEHQAKELLQHIAATANEADALCYRLGEKDAATLATVLRELACRIGWMADLALTKLGSDPVVGGAEIWLLPPSYHWITGAPRRVRHDE